jgi:cellulose/xylan binding protein with CBM9 domain
MTPRSTRHSTSSRTPLLLTALVLLLALLVIRPTLAAEADGFRRVITFTADGKEQEQKFLWKDDSRTFVLGGWGKPVRNLDGEDRFVIWRFDTADTSRARVSVNLVNSFAMSISANGEDFEEGARESAQAGSNVGWKSADLSKLLPSDYVYVKVTHGDPEKWNGGFGACIFEVKFDADDERDIAVGQAARTQSPITIDGTLDEAAWQTAQPLSTLSDRHLSRPVTRGTTFRLCYDDHHWYVAAECIQPGAPEVAVTAKEHDTPVYSEDAAEFFFVPPGEKGLPDTENGPHYHLAANLMGVVFDELNSDGGETWDSGAKVVVKRYLQGWTLEAAIPAESMGVTALLPGQEWRVGLYRVDIGFAQFAQWSSTLGGGFHHRDRFGKITLVDTPSAPLPSVNLVLPAERTLGENPAKVVLTGEVTAKQHALILDVFPVEATSMKGRDQDLEQMNPVLAAIPLADMPTESLDASYLLDRFGAALVVATLTEKENGRILSRASTNVLLTPGDVKPIEFTTLQPYVTSEPDLPAEVILNMDETKRKGAQLGIAILDANGKEVHVIEPRAAVERTELTMPIKQLVLGEYRVVATITSAEGNVLASAERPLTKHEPFGVPMKVEIRDGLCYVNGEPKLPLGFMLASPERVIPEAGYNTALYGGETLEGRNEMDTAAANGVWVMSHICHYLNGKHDYDAIRAVVSLRKTEPALFVWYLADEPEGHGNTPDVLRKAYEIIKTIDPNHPVAILTNAPAMLSQYEGCADIIMADPYVIPGLPLSLVADWTDAAAKAAAAHNQAAWITPQGFGWSDIGKSDEPSPTREELSNMLYTSFIHGAKGIIWWPYGVPRSNYWPHFRKMGRECRFFEPWILQGKDAPGMPAGAQVSGDLHWRAFRHQDETLIIAANLGRQARTLTIPLPADTREVSFPFDEDLEALKSWAPGEPISLRLAPVQTLVAVVE